MRRAAEVPVGLNVQVGLTCEVTRDEARALTERAYQLQVLTRHQKPGWFAAYVMTMNEINRTIRNIVQRAHEK